jgi:hypothetical protein
MTDQTVTVTVPFAIRKRGGRTLVITPDGLAAAPTPRSRVDSALLKALAFRMFPAFLIIAVMLGNTPLD